MIMSTHIFPSLLFYSNSTISCLKFIAFVSSLKICSNSTVSCLKFVWLQFTETFKVYWHYRLNWNLRYIGITDSWASPYCSRLSTISRIFHWYDKKLIHSEKYPNQRMMVWRGNSIIPQHFRMNTLKLHCL